jgi:Uri superfamily endonuclease
MDKGVYVLILALDSDRWITVGRLGRLRFSRGTYAYVGSAFGPGGLAARLGHHLKISAKPHWHIDAFRRQTDIVEVWYSEGRRCEHLWARVAAELPEAATPIAGFGSSDCRCRSHLIFFRRRPRIAQFARHLKLHTGSSPGVKRLNIDDLPAPSEKTRRSRPRTHRTA